MTDDQAPEILTGGCQCGAVRYEIDASAIQTFYACHCTECQRQSASAFGLSIKINPEDLRLTKGELAAWQRSADSGAINRARYCRDCGVRIHHDGGGGPGDWVSLKGGTLDNPGELAPVGHIWTRSARPWVVLPKDLLIYEAEPNSYQALVEAWRNRPA